MVMMMMMMKRLRRGGRNASPIGARYFLLPGRWVGRIRSLSMFRNLEGSSCCVPSSRSRIFGGVQRS